jgi:vacuolar-type H+-ATPase subunit I/STV1
LGFGFDIFGWLTFPFPILLTVIPGLLLLLLKPLGKVFKISYLEEETVGGLIGEGSIEAFDTVLSVMSNVASYIRLLALALAHIALLTSINAMVGLIEGEGIGIEIVHLIGSIFGNMVVILLEGLLVFLNSMRLHFYEFMGKFYQGSGIEFFPFYLDDDYSTIVFRVGAERDIISEEIDKEFEVKSGKEDVNRAVDYISEKYK